VSTARPGIRLAFSTLGCPDLAIAEVAEVAARHGFCGVELRAAAGQPVHAGLGPARRRDIASALTDRGVDVLSLASYVRVADPATDDDAVVGDALAHARLAADLGASFLRVFPGGPTGTSPAPGGTPDAPAGSAEARGCADAAAIRRLTRIRDALTGSGVRIALETHDSHPGGADVARILDGCPGVLAIWDTLHTWRAGEAPADTVRSLAGRLAYVQVKDVAAADDLAPLPPGAGVLPLTAVADALRANGYRGPVSWEYERAWFPDAPPLPELAAGVAGWMRATFGIG
jgi:sugar phosphate isomerase/epimerase